LSGRPVVTVDDLSQFLQIFPGQIVPQIRLQLLSIPICPVIIHSLLQLIQHH